MICFIAKYFLGTKQKAISKIVDHVPRLHAGLHIFILTNYGVHQGPREAGLHADLKISMYASRRRFGLKAERTRST
jgi:hypothetical protein